MSRQAISLSGSDVGRLIDDAEGFPWRIVEVHHYPTGVCIDVHHPDVGNWATTEPPDEVEYGLRDSIDVRQES